MIQSMKLPLLMLLVSLSAIVDQPAPAHEGDQVHESGDAYIPTHFFTGTLYIGTVKQLTERQAAQLGQEFGGEPKTLMLIGASAVQPIDPCASCLLETKWRSIVHYKAPGETLVSEREGLADELKRLAAGSCVWLHACSLKDSDDAAHAWLTEQLADCLRRDVTVCIDCAATSAVTDRSAQPMRSGLIAASLSLMPSIQLRHLADQSSLLEPDGVVISVPDDAWVRVRGRELFNLSASNELVITWPKTDQYPRELVEHLQPRTVCDLVAARRSLAERNQPAFPADGPYDHRLSNGSLIIVGGGGAPPEIWQKFVALAGGESARIVVLPTAVPEPESRASEARIFQQLGAKQVKVLPQIDRDDVSSAAYLENFQSATGVWFGGGRQWRFVDAYWGTPAWSAIVGVAHRGGVIGGSSAGATIQGDLLVRGHPLGNHVMVADGYRRGLGLLPGVAIDQHFRQRNRFDDLAGVVKRFPQILGIGIDEATALVVEAPDKCSVIGQGSVWLSYPTQEPRAFVERATGTEFQLNAPEPGMP